MEIFKEGVKKVANSKLGRIGLAGVAAAGLAYEAVSNHFTPSVEAQDLNPTVRFLPQTAETVLVNPEGTTFRRYLEAGDILIVAAQRVEVAGTTVNVSPEIYPDRTAVVALLAASNMDVEWKLPTNSGAWQTTERSQKRSYEGQLDDAGLAAEVQSGRMQQDGNCGIQPGCNFVETSLLVGWKDEQGTPHFALAWKEQRDRNMLARTGLGDILYESAASEGVSVQKDRTTIFRLLNKGDILLAEGREATVAGVTLGDRNNFRRTIIRAVGVGDQMGVSATYPVGAGGYIVAERSLSETFAGFVDDINNAAEVLAKQALAGYDVAQTEAYTGLIRNGVPVFEDAGRTRVAR